jgi:chemotaxis family two-component system sensor kinase Cph1
MMSSHSDQKIAVDLTSCDREPIHTPGSIQPFGALLVVSDPGLVVLEASANTENILGIAPGDLLGAPLSRWLSADSLVQLMGALAVKYLERNLPLALSLGDRPFEATLHRQHGELLLDIEPASVEPDLSVQAFYSQTRRALDAMRAAPDLGALCAAAAEEVTRLTGYDRVMIYRFHPDGHGEVVAEQRNENLEAFLGLHYPASDIPQQARVLYLRNWLRLLPDVNYAPVPLLSAKVRPPLDLSDSALRSFSPIHLEYLRNMGVTATMTISLLHNDALWGLIACHHYSAKPVSPKIRTACELVGHVMSLQVGQKLARLESQQRQQMDAALDAFADAMAAEGNQRNLDPLAPAFADMVHADGLAISDSSGLATHGTVPAPEDLEALVAWFASEPLQEVWATDELASHYPPAAAFVREAAGMLAVACSHGRYLLWFRGEQLQAIRWAGDPSKPVSVGPMGDRVTPRGSFAEWQQDVHGRSRAWEPHEIEMAERLRRLLLEADARRADQAEIARMRELERVKTSFLSAVSHELRTPLNFITGFASLLLDEGAGPNTREQSKYLERILMGSDQLLALVDDLLDYARMEAGHFSLDPRLLELGEVVEVVVGNLQPLLDAKQLAIDLDLAPDSSLMADATRLGQVLYNLLSNAIKFSPPGGRIRIRSEVTETTVRLEIIDQGRGIAPADLPLLFDKFFQAKELETGTGGQNKGTGLGLAIVKSLIEAHGGTVGAKSELGAGACFYIELPKSLATSG